MSDEQTQPDETAGGEDPAEQRPCTVCRGTGIVLSNLGGTLREQPCPWCDGGGVFLTDHDAQAARREG